MFAFNELLVIKLLVMCDEELKLKLINNTSNRPSVIHQYLCTISCVINTFIYDK